MANGRPCKLTPELQAKICGVIRKGNYISTACQASGIAQRTYERWIKLGRESKNAIYIAFVEAIKKAEADSEEHLLGIVLNSSITNWQAAMTMLERRFPDRWGRRERLEHELKGEITLRIVDDDKGIDNPPAQR